MVRPLLFCAFFFAYATSLRADEDGLSGSVGEDPAYSVPAPREAGHEEMPFEGDDDPPPPKRYAPTPKPSLRFDAEEKTRLRRWLTGLCREDAVAPELAERLRGAREGEPIVARARNKQGSLLLQLENYAELAEYRDRCEAERRRDPDACRHRGRVPKPGAAKNAPWDGFHSASFWKEIRTNRAPAGVEVNTDLLRAADAQVKTIGASLRKNFFELRDAADLDGKPGSGAKARALAGIIHDDSTCGTRAVGEDRAPAAQK